MLVEPIKTTLRERAKSYSGKVPQDLANMIDAECEAFCVMHFPDRKSASEEAFQLRMRWCRLALGREEMPAATTTVTAPMPASKLSQEHRARETT